jgi:type I restriction-modification system DNA methylase subunit
MTNMFLHDIDESSNIKHNNMFSRPLKSYVLNDRMDVVFTNLPFGGYGGRRNQAKLPDRAMDQGDGRTCYWC